MCTPGIRSNRTDDELANKAQRHYKAFLIASEELRRRGWRVAIDNLRHDKVVVSKLVEWRLF